MNFHATIKDGQLKLSPVETAMRQRLLASYKDGTMVRETITKEGRAKTCKQIETIFGLVMSTVIQYFDDNGWDSSIILNTKLPTGVSATVSLLKEYFYAVCPIEDDEGKRITLSSDKVTTVIAAKFIDDTRNYAASQWGIYIPDPSPNWREEKNKKIIDNPE